MSGTEKKNTQGCANRAGCSVGVKNAGGAPCAGISSVPGARQDREVPALVAQPLPSLARLRKQLGSQQWCQHHQLTHPSGWGERAGQRLQPPGVLRGSLAPQLTRCHRAGQAALSASVSPSAKHGSKGLVCLEGGSVSQSFLMRGVWGACVRPWEFQISDSAG